MDNETEDKLIYIAVINIEEQYSIWPEHKPVPRGWRDAGKRGLKGEVLRWIGEVWTDMRPLSVRRQIEELRKANPSPSR
jgi:MbtH protein